jgi:hypothetical protein
MGRPKTLGDSVTVNVVFPRTLAEQIDAYVVRFMADNPGVVIRRSDIVRMAVEKLIRAQEAERAVDKRAPAGLGEAREAKKVLRKAAR